MRKFKGITLVELLVAMAVFSIIMLGVMNMVQPVQRTATDAKIMNYQKTNEETIVTYLSEQMRYANNLMIIEDGAQYELTKDVNDYNGDKMIEKSKITVDSPAKAMQAFASGMGIKNQYGEILKPWSDANGQFIHMLVWDGINEYQIDNTPAKYKGRLLAAHNGNESTVTMHRNNFSYIQGSGSTVTANGGVGLCTSPSATLGNLPNAVSKDQLYFLFGKGYFGTSDIYLDMSIKEENRTDPNTHQTVKEAYLTIKCTSDYYMYSADSVRRKLNTDDSTNGSKFNASKNNPTVSTVQLRNYGQFNDHMLFMKKSKPNEAFSSTRAAGNIFYIVYTTDEDMDNIMNYGERGENDEEKKDISSWSSSVATYSWKYHSVGAKDKNSHDVPSVPVYDWRSSYGTVAVDRNNENLIKSDGYIHAEVEPT